MLTIRGRDTRGIVKNDWMFSRRTFSNNSYRDPRYINFHSLCAINDDILQPGHKIPWHEHKSLDILGYLVDGRLQHVDSEGYIATVGRGEVQHMGCGPSIWHSEECCSAVPARYIQLWFFPTQIDLSTTEYETYTRPTESFSKLDIPMKNDMIVEAGLLASDYFVKDGYLYCIEGSCRIGDAIIVEGDGVEITNETISPSTMSHLILFNAA